MIRFDFVSAVPELLSSPLSGSILGRAQAKGLLEIGIHQLHDYSANKHRRVDDYPYGGGGGMVMQVEPIERCISSLKSQRRYDFVLFMSPDGVPFDHRIAVELTAARHILILCGHYQGVDERVRGLGLIDRELSIGDYVLTGGELPALVVCDAVVRLLPGVLGDGRSALGDAFQDDLLSAPLYTRPAVYKGHAVPEVLLKGDQKAIDAWREAESLARTRVRRPYLLEEDRIDKKR